MLFKMFQTFKRFSRINRVRPMPKRDISRINYTTWRYVLKKAYTLEGKSLVKIIRSTCERCRYLRCVENGCNVEIPDPLRCQLFVSASSDIFHMLNESQLIKACETVQFDYRDIQ